MDPALGYILHVTTSAGNEYLVGLDDSVQITLTPSQARVALRVSPSGPVEDIQQQASGVTALPVNTGDFQCPQVDMLEILQRSFAKQGATLTAGNLGDKEGQSTFTCGDSYKTMIRLGRDLEVLESREKLGERIQNNDFRRVEPPGYFRGAHYLLTVSFYSWWDPYENACKCQFNWRIVQVRTARILRAATVVKICGDLESDFDAMLSQVEIAVSNVGEPAELYSTPDTQMPYCYDGNPCTLDSFNQQTGQCQFIAYNEGRPCDDRNLCTLNEYCRSGQCIGQTKNCSDQNQCTDDTCEPTTGQCSNTNVVNGTTCDDGDQVTEDDICTDGVCQGTVGMLPYVPLATGAPYFSPNPVTGNGQKTTVYIPVNEDANSVSVRLYNKETKQLMVMTSSWQPFTGPTVVQVETPWIYSSAGQLYLQFFIDNFSTGGYSHYTWDSANSDAFYSLYQNDGQGHVVEMLSDISIGWLNVVPPP